LSNSALRTDTARDIDLPASPPSPITKAGYILVGAFLGYLVPWAVSFALARMFPQLRLSTMLLVSYVMCVPALIAVWGRRYLAIGIAIGAAERILPMLVAVVLWAVARYRI
jgi:hypothetical protein